MSTRLQVLSLRIRVADDGWQDPYELDAPVVAIVGPVDTGKSSFVDCIAFALGKDIDAFRGAVHAHLREVEICIQVDSGIYTLRRARKTSSYIEVFDATGTLLDQFPVKPKEERQTVGSWLLEQLGLDDKFASVRLPGGKGIDFYNGLLPYCYLTQDDIDRHVIQSPRYDTTRLMVLKLLLNLTTPERERLNGLIRDVGNEIDKRRRQAQLIKEFLSESESTNLDAITDQVNQLKLKESEAAARLEKWKTDARAASQLDEFERQRIVNGRKAVGDAEQLLDNIRKRYEAAHSRLMACREALETLSGLETQSPDDRPTLRLAWRNDCPICNSDISNRTPRPGCCYLCGELLPGENHPAERKHLESAYSEAMTEETTVAKAMSEANTRAQASRTVLRRLLKEGDERAGDVVTPYVDAIAHASSDLARIRGELISIERIVDSHDRLSKKFGDIAELEEKQKVWRSQVVETDQLESLEDVVLSLNEIFRRIVQGIELPHATGQARLDPENLMPLVDEQKFAQRGGGARAAVSIAYSLTLLFYTLENELAHLPGLLIIDSPQKNFGSNKVDKALAHRVYDRFLDYTSELRGIDKGRFHRPFQLIIVDNDIHPDIRRRVKVHQFDRDDGFIRNLTDPHRTSGWGEQLALDGSTNGSE